MGTDGGMIQNAFDGILACWEGHAGPTTPWKLTLAVVDCVGSNVRPCSKVLGAVELNVIWISRTGFKNYVEKGAGSAPLPVSMAGIPGVVDSWSSPGGTPANIWNDFVDHFHLRNVDGTPATAKDKTIYFLPDCAPHVPAGKSGGENFGILAKIPVIVK
jgi:hypothetical protein